MLRSRRTRARLSVSSSVLGRNDAVARDFEAELEDQESLDVVIENLSKNLDDLENAEPLQLSDNNQNETDPTPRLRPKLTAKKPHDDTYRKEKLIFSLWPKLQQILQPR